jgi:hypothetical protein
MEQTDKAGQSIQESTKARVRAALEKEYQINRVDLFVDYTRKDREINIFSGRTDSFSDHLRDLLAPSVCPRCQSPELKRSNKWSLKGWLLRFTGRKVFRCSDCGWTEVVKIKKWDWEVVTTAFITILIILIASIYWIRR